MIEEPADDDVVQTETSAMDNGLGARMRRRATQLETQTTEVFPVPRFEDILGVEFRVMSWEALRKIGQRHQRVRNEALQELYIAADTVLAATEGFFQFGADEGQEPVEGQTWRSLAVATRDGLTEDVSPRQALIALLGDTNVVFLWNDYQEWLRATRPEVEEELKADFPTTKSPS